MSSTSQVSPVFVQVRGISNYGSWYPNDTTTSGVVSMVQSFRAATGRPVSVFSIVQGPQDPTELVKGQGVNINTFLTDLKTAAGGDIIPTIKMNYYTSGTGLTAKSYCDPHNSTNCGPSWFYQVSSELLSLTAIQGGSKKLLLDGFPQFSRDVNYNATTISSALAGLKAQGWQYLITKQGTSSNTVFPDYGYGSYMYLTTSCQTTTPYCSENGNITSSYLSSSAGHLGVIGMFDDQIINSPSPPTGLATFFISLTSTQQVSALTSLASSQTSGRYSFVYPLIVGTSRDGVAYYWNAARALQSGGLPFISLEETLATDTTSTSTSTISATTPTSTSISTNITSTSTTSTLSSSSTSVTSTSQSTSLTKTTTTSSTSTATSTTLTSTTSTSTFSSSTSTSITSSVQSVANLDIVLSTTPNVNTQKSTEYFTVQVSDHYGNPIGGANVSLSVTKPDGKIFTIKATTNSAGQAYFKFTLSAAAQLGVYTVFTTASVRGYLAVVATGSFTVS